MSVITGVTVTSFIHRARRRKLAGPTAEKVRRALTSDNEKITLLFNNQVKQLFGEVDALEILCKCFLSLVLENKNDELVGCMCMSDHPNVPSIPSWEWSHWLYNLYRLETVTPWNSLWVHLFAYDNAYMFVFVRPLIKALFRRIDHLENLLMVAPPGVIQIEWLEGMATRILPVGYSDPIKVQTVYLMVRQHFVTKYKVRRAVEEDNDDLVPLIHSYSPRLKEIYGEFYISEILTRHKDSGRQIIVAEYGGIAVAVLVLNSTLNFNLLNEQYELIPFYGLKKPDIRDNIELPRLNVQLSVTGLAITDEEGRLPQQITPPPPEPITPAESESIVGTESEIELDVQSVDSEDDFFIVNVSSCHLNVVPGLFRSESVTLTSDESQYSAIILSDNEIIPRMYKQTVQKLPNNISLEYIEINNVKSSAYTPKVPVYYGEENAFALEIAAAQPEHEYALIHLLDAAFECFSDRDYCIMTIPSTDPTFPLLERFVRVPPRPVSTISHELYVLHKNALTSVMTVRAAVRSDMEVVEQLVSTLVKPEPLIAAFRSAVFDDESEHRAFLVLSDQTAVGVAVLKEEEDVEYLRTHYEMRHWLDEKRHRAGHHGLIEFGVISPIFKRHSQFILRELHRLSDNTILYYYISPEDTSAYRRERPLVSFLTDMLFVKPKQKPENNYVNLDGCEPADVVNRIDPPFALYCTTTRNCSLPRYEINTRIVVVGSSNTAIAFLETLLCTASRHYEAIFCNVTLVAPHGLNMQKSPIKVRDMLFVINSNLTYRHVHLHQLRTYVNLINGVLTAIDRKEKRIVINDECFLSYDLLFLMCGEQFQKPSKSDHGKKKHIKEFPENVFIINTETDAGNALSKLNEIVTGLPKYKVVIYGHNLEAYCCIAALREFGVPGSNITFVEPFPPRTESTPPHSTSFFNDGDVDAALQEALQKEGIEVYQAYYFRDWNYDADKNLVRSIKLESKHQFLDIECQAVFFYCEKAISTRTFLAINRAGLVFDGRLVIGPDCRTNDPNIYAAGTLTKYSRRYYADDMEHKYFNKSEIGKNLGKQIRKKLIPMYTSDEDTSLEIQSPLKCDKNVKMLVPKYKEPLITYCQLPGGLYYLYVTKPGVQVPLETALNFSNYGHVLVTGNCSNLDKQGYFRLHLNEFRQVETITCLAKFEMDRVNICTLWGKHETLLNNVTLRYDMLGIADLYEFFKEPWTCAIYHDRFSMFDSNVSKLLHTFGKKRGDSLIEELLKAFKENGWKPLPTELMDETESKFITSKYSEKIQHLLLKYLEENASFLPMYAYPLRITEVLQGYENSPLFQKQ